MAVPGALPSWHQFVERKYTEPDTIAMAGRATAQELANKVIYTSQASRLAPIEARLDRLL
ncbi:hypothetical protein SAMN04487915_111187 [Arthrobacter sp. ov118]|nr:hypothetical protein SAMN04487915_111187 [Arthrobacter sp. ov118]